MQKFSSWNFKFKCWIFSQKNMPSKGWNSRQRNKKANAAKQFMFPIKIVHKINIANPVEPWFEDVVRPSWEFPQNSPTQKIPWQIKNQPPTPSPNLFKPDEHATCHWRGKWKCRSSGMFIESAGCPSVCPSCSWFAGLLISFLLKRNLLCGMRRCSTCFANCT